MTSTTLRLCTWNMKGSHSHIKMKKDNVTFKEGEGWYCYVARNYTYKVATVWLWLDQFLILYNQKQRSGNTQNSFKVFHYSLWWICSIILLNVALSMWHSLSLRDAHISQILKKAKCPEDCASYKLISLLNVDLKILSKVLARRLESLLPILVKEDQTGLIKAHNSNNNIIIL